MAFSTESAKPPHPPETGKLLSFTIPHPEFVRGGKHGEIAGVVFEGKFFHLHPDEYADGEQGLRSATALHVEAKKRTEEAGFVNEDGYAVYHTHAVEMIGRKPD